jgi:release factor glutamine methyltransferase
MTLQIALQQACRLLEEESVAAPRLTAEVLLCHALGCERSYLYSHPEAELSNVVRMHYGRYLHERLAGKPTQYITGRQEFYGRDFLVTPDVLIPRPETEHVVEAALAAGPLSNPSLTVGALIRAANVRERSSPDALVPAPRRIVDVGCGSGAIAVTLSLEMNVEVVATDISVAALAVAAKNAKKLNARVEFVACDLAAAFAPGSLDLVVSNPPYVALADAPGLQREVRDHEPHVALFAGETGLEIYARLVKEAERVLRPGGALVMELGFNTSEPVRAMLGPRWRDVQILPDLAGIPRVLVARLP